MNNKLIITLTLILLLGTTASLGVEHLIATINVKIQKDNQDNIWRVKDNQGQNKGTIVSSRNDKINWQTIGSEMVFTFPEEIDGYFTYEQGLFEDGRSQRVEANKKLRLTVRENAPQDTLEYTVYVVAADTFVVGDSPPKLIIR
ncbi:hypothetical protein [Fodinibius sp.]|uniref:hypothetical protein n=1 Tax=Fodinibius sp. TaxID=1872440 RepID=UPI002ACE04CF|nr:hypothetical protein [Fodinibius sp.]MDZ7659792.1 hypothetical protein [Fodinibius sp.]